MSLFRYFLPILIFVGVFVGTGAYLSYQGVPDAYYQLPPVSALMPAVICAWLLHRGSSAERMHDFLEGMRHRDIITMCVIFLLAGAFSTVTQEIGSVKATVNAALALVPPPFILTGIFLVTGFIATAIGTSMGAVATIAPVAVGLSDQVGLSPALMCGTVVGGAMFGDNLSLISDTTIAAVMSQEADMRAKLILNIKVACVAGVVTILYLVFQVKEVAVVHHESFSWWLISPYIVLIGLALWGVHVFSSVAISIIWAGILGLLWQPDFTLIRMAQCVQSGFLSMAPILLLSLLVGGLSGLVGSKMVAETTKKLTHSLARYQCGRRTAAGLIAASAGVLDILLANNTVAIILSGEMARSIAAQFKIPKHVSAAWLDISSCVFQGIIPYGGQILLASSMAHVSPLELVPYVFYCFALLLAMVIFIVRNKD